MATLAANALTTLADVKETMGVASSDHSYDNLIIRKINQVTAQFEKYCGRRFKEATYTDEGYNGTGTDQIVLKNYPITSTVAFSLGNRDNSLNENDWETVDTNRYFANNSSGVIDLTFTAGGGWGRWRATYSAGYATIPDDLAEAAATLAAYYTLNADTSGVGVTKKKEGQREINYSSLDLSFDELMKNLGLDSILQSYMNYPLNADK